jgi:hypothetical protein
MLLLDPIAGSSLGVFDGVVEVSGRGNGASGDVLRRLDPRLTRNQELV